MKLKLLFLFVCILVYSEKDYAQKANQSNTKKELLCRKWELVEKVINDSDGSVEVVTTIIKPIPIEKKQIYIFYYDNSFKEFMGANEIERDGLWSFNNDSTNITLKFQQTYIANENEERIENITRTFLITKLTNEELRFTDVVLESSTYLIYTSK